MLFKNQLRLSVFALLFTLLSIMVLTQKSRAFDPCGAGTTDCEEATSDAGEVPTYECGPVSPMCLQERISGEQDPRQTYKDDTIRATANDLPSDTITLPDINQGIPPISVPVSPSQPIPPLILRGILWQESRWLQFADSIGDPDDRIACTLVSPDCGYGMVQLTDCMSSDPNIGCMIATIDRERVAGEVLYNLSGGMHTLIGKWNDAVPFIGDNNHTDPNQWYYGVTAYNGWSWCNNPNRTEDMMIMCFNPPFLSERPPFGLQETGLTYPYQEKVYGSLMYPRPILEPGIVAYKLWRSSYIPMIPRGIWGSEENNWQPPINTPRPITYLFHNVRSNIDSSSTIVFTNPTDELLAADIAFYDEDHTFEGWGYLTGDTYFRVEAGELRSIALDGLFPPGSNFNGYARINASEGLEIEVVNPTPTSYQVFLPTVVRDDSTRPECDTHFTEDFEGFDANGQLTNWDIYANDRYFASDGTNLFAYALADGTWFRNGNNGGYLGGYLTGNFELKSHLFYVPTTYQGPFYLQFSWYVRTSNLADEAQADLKLFLEDEEGRWELDEHRLTNLDGDTRWYESRINLRREGINPGELFSIIFNSYNTEIDEGRTQFFIDDL